MVPMWFARRRSENASLSIKSAALLLVAAFVVAGFAMPLGAAQESGGGGGGGGPAPGGDANNTTSPALPDLVIASLRQTTMGDPCCEPVEPTPEPYSEPEPCCEPVQPTPEAPEPCCGSEPDDAETCCPYDPPVALYVESFEVVVANEGATTAYEVLVEVRGPQGWVHETVPSIDVGDQAVLVVFLEAEAGRFSVAAEADPSGAVAEIFESNNDAVIDAQFGPAPLPDLMAQSLWLRSDEHYGHPYVTVELRLTNNGDAASGPFRVVAFMDGHLIETLDHAGLQPGEVTEHAIGLGSPWRDAVVVINIDAYAEVEEHNEWNNVLHAYHAGSRPDLAVSGLEAPQLPLSGTTDAPEATVRFQVENRGDAGSYPFRYVLLLDDVVVAEADLPGLQPGTSVDVETMIPAQPGTFLLEVLVDSDDWVEERDERNNQDATVADFGHPDLVASLDVVDPDGAEYGDDGSMVVTVRNDGRFAAAPTRLEVRDGQTALATLDVEALAAGGERRFVLPWTLAPGVHTLTADADAASELVEAAEANNRAEATIDLGTPELTVENMTWDQDTPEEGRPLHVTTQVRYGGRLGLDATKLRLAIDGAAFDEWHLESLEPGDAFTAMSEWHPTEGDHAITAIVDPDDAWPEGNETDNMRTGALYVRAPTPAVCTTAPDAQETCRRVLLAEEDPLLLNE